MYHWPLSQSLVPNNTSSVGEVFMKKTQTRTDKKAVKAVVELSEKELAGVAGGRRIIIYQCR